MEAEEERVNTSEGRWEEVDEAARWRKGLSSG